MIRNTKQKKMGKKNLTRLRASLFPHPSLFGLCRWCFVYFGVFFSAAFDLPFSGPEEHQKVNLLVALAFWALGLQERPLVSHRTPEEDRLLYCSGGEIVHSLAKIT